MARVFIESEVTSVRSVVSEPRDGRPSEHQKRVQIKAKMMEDGPRHRQSTVIICLWIGRITICHPPPMKILLF